MGEKGLQRMIRMDYKQLIEKAREALQNAHVPYSNYQVGAAVLTTEDNIYNGCNIENASYGATVCAERVAIFKAVSNGEKQIKALALVTGAGDFPTPCGICRQVMVEFATDDFEIILSNDDKTEVYKMDQLLPLSFSSKNLLDLDL